MKEHLSKSVICNKKKLYFKEYQEIKSIEGLYNFFKLSAKRKETIKSRIECEKLYEDILDKHDKTLQLLRDSISIMDYKGSKKYYPNKKEVKKKEVKEIVIEKPKEVVKELKTKVNVLSLKELLKSRKKNLCVLTDDLSCKFSNETIINSPTSQRTSLRNLKSTWIRSTRSCSEMRQKYSRVDLTPIYKPFMKYYKILAKSRKLMAGPLDCLIKSTNKRNNRYQINHIIQSPKPYTGRINKRRTLTKNITPKYMHLHKRKIDLMKPNKSPIVENIKSIMEKFNRYENEAELESIKDSCLRLKQDCLCLQRKLKGDTSANIEDYCEKIISRSASEFRRNRIGFVYGAEAKGRYIFEGVRDKVRELDYVIHSRIKH